MLQGVARGEVVEEREVPDAVPVECLTTTTGLASNVPMPMPNLPLHARCAAHSVDEHCPSFITHLWPKPNTVKVEMELTLDV